MTHFTAASIQVVNAGPDGVLGTADDVTIPIDPTSITMTLLDKGIGGNGAEQISFSTSGTLTNNLYQITLLNTGADAVRDIAGNVTASPVTDQFAVDVPALAAEPVRRGQSRTSPTRELRSAAARTPTRPSARP